MLAAQWSLCIYAGAMYFLYLQLGLASLVAITVLILLMPLQVSCRQQT